MPKSLARVQPIRASRPNRGRVPTKSCTTTKPSRAPIRVVQNEYPSRGLTNRRAARSSKPSSRTAAPRAQHAHSAVQTPDTRTRPCTHPSTRALGRADARAPEHSAVQTPDTSHPSTRPCRRLTRALGRAHTRALGRACARHAHSAVQTPEHSAMQTPDTRTRPCTHPSTRPCMRSTRALGRTVLPNSPWTFCAPHSHI